VHFGQHHVDHIDVDGTVGISPGMVSRGRRIGRIKGTELKAENTYIVIMLEMVNHVKRLGEFLGILWGVMRFLLQLYERLSFHTPVFAVRKFYRVTATYINEILRGPGYISRL